MKEKVGCFSSIVDSVSVLWLKNGIQLSTHENDFHLIIRNLSFPNFITSHRKTQQLSDEFIGGVKIAIFLDRF